MRGVVRRSPQRALSARSAGALLSLAPLWPLPHRSAGAPPEPPGHASLALLSPLCSCASGTTMLPLSGPSLIPLLALSYP